MAVWNKEKLRTRVLQHLNVLGAGQDASADDAEVVDEAIDAAHSELRTLGIAPFKVDEIPEYAQMPLRNYVAAKVSASFALSPQRRLELEAGVQQAMNDIRDQLFVYDSTTTSSLYF